VCHFCQKTGRATLWAILFTNSSGIPDLGQKLWFEFLYFLRNKNVKLLRGIVILKDYYPLLWIFSRIFTDFLRIFSRIFTDFYGFLRIFTDFSRIFHGFFSDFSRIFLGFFSDFHGSFTDFSTILTDFSRIYLISFPFSVSLCPSLSGPGPPRRIPGRTANPE
jgi:hypothetical protein